MSRTLLMSFICFLLSSMAAETLSAQSPEVLFKKVTQQAATSFVTVTYTIESSGKGMEFSDSGTIQAQDKMWHLDGGYVEIFTDEDATWVLYAESKEAYIEPAWTLDDLMSFYSSASSSGARLEIKLLSTHLSEKKPAAFFTPSLSQDWVVIDIR